MLALCAVLGSVGCTRSFAPAGRSSQQGSDSRAIDLTSSSGPRWPLAEPKSQAGLALTDADVERIAERVAHDRVPLPSVHNPSKGAANAKVTLQVWSDFECPFCVRAAPALSAVEARFRGRVRLVWRNYPLPSHARARPAARAALEAFSQGGAPTFWKLHDWLFSERADLSEAGLAKAGERFGLDARKLQNAWRDTRYDARVDADIAAGDRAGIEGTPAVFINDYYLMGARDVAEYMLVAERALREAT